VRRNVKTLAINAAVVTALVGGTVTYVTQNNTVTLTVDGEEQELTTFASSVEDVLEEEDIELGEHDTVAPAPDSSIREGAEINVRYARQLTVNVDGEEQQHWTTARSVDEALLDLDIRAEGAELSVARSKSIGRDGLEFDLSTPKDITFVVAGEEKSVTTTALTVEEALDDAEINVGSADELQPAPATPISTGDTVTLDRINREQVTETESIDFETVTKDDEDMLVGEEEVVTEGEEGEREKVLSRTYRNGELVWEKVVENEVSTEPVDEVLAVGAKEPEPEPEPDDDSDSDSSDSGSDDSSGSSDDSGSSSDDSSSDDSSSSDDDSSGGSSSSDDDYSGDAGVWDDLAECESGGDWSINTGNGYYGGLQFNLQTWEAYGGSGMPHEASKSEQIAIATKVRDDRGGYGAWPACAASLGLPT